MPIYQIKCELCKNEKEIICSHSKLEEHLKAGCWVCLADTVVLKPSSVSFTFKDSPNSNTEVTSYDGRPTGYNDW
jgi:predicted nucleic acid-binding Zn ribbon protein